MANYGYIQLLLILVAILLIILACTIFVTKIIELNNLQTGDNKIKVIFEFFKLLKIETDVDHKADSNKNKTNSDTPEV